MGARDINKSLSLVALRDCAVAEFHGDSVQKGKPRFTHPSEKMAYIRPGELSWTSLKIYKNINELHRFGSCKRLHNDSVACNCYQHTSFCLCCFCSSRSIRTGKDLVYLYQWSRAHSNYVSYLVWWPGLVRHNYVYWWLDLHVSQWLVLSMPSWRQSINNHCPWKWRTVSFTLTLLSIRPFTALPFRSTTTTASGGSGTLVPGYSFIRAVVGQI